MNGLRLAGLAVTALALAAPLPAHADGATFRGGCAFATVSDVTPGGQLGGPDTWTGVIRLAVVATDAGIPTGGTVTAWCELYINGVLSGPVLGPVTGTGVVVAAGPLTFTAAPTDVVEPCTVVTTASGTERVCSALTGSLVPQQVSDLVDQFWTVADPPLSLGHVVDPVICPVLASLPQPLGPVSITAQGDVFLASHLVHDCPPYVA